MCFSSLLPTLGCKTLRDKGTAGFGNIFAGPDGTRPKIRHLVSRNIQKTKRSNKKLEDVHFLPEIQTGRQKPINHKQINPRFGLIAPEVTLLEI